MEHVKEKGNKDEVKVIEAKIKENIFSTNFSIEQEGLLNDYFVIGYQTLNESQQVMKERKQDNLRGDSYKLVSVIYSLVLFLLGIVGVLKAFGSRKILFVFSVDVLIFGIIYMLTIPMPTGFNITNFFNHQ